MGLEKIGLYKGEKVSLQGKINKDLKEVVKEVSNYDYSKPMSSNENSTETLDLDSFTGQSNTSQANVEQSSIEQSNTAQLDTEQANATQLNTEQSNVAQSSTVQANTGQTTKTTANYKEYSEACTKDLNDQAGKISDVLDVLEEKRDKLEKEIGGLPTKDTMSDKDYELLLDDGKKIVDDRTKKKEEMNEIDSQISELSQTFYLLCQERDVKKFECVQDLSDFDEVVNKDYHDQGLDELLNEYNNYLDDYQKNVLKYMYIKEGRKKAEKYIDVLEDQINRYKGLEDATAFMKKVKDNPEQVTDELSDIFDTSKEGLGDGINSFFENIGNYFSTNTVPSELEYKQMFILAMLQGDKSQLKGLVSDEYLNIDRNELATVYQFSSSMGNMLPTIVLSATIEAVSAGTATPATAGVITSVTQVAGSTAMGISAAGGAKKQALEQGYTPQEAMLYGTLSGISEGALGYLIGGLPGVSKSSEGFIKEIIHEGTEEGIQEVVSAGLGATILGQDVEIGSLAEQSAQAFAMGALTSAFMNGGQVVIKKGLQVSVDANTVYKLYKEGKYDDIVNMVQSKASSTTNSVKEKITTTKNNIKNKKNNVKKILNKKFKIGAKETSSFTSAFNLYEASNYNASSTISPEVSKVSSNIAELYSSDFKTTVDGIDFVSTSSEGLNSLVDYYDSIKQKNSNLSGHIEGLSNKQLKITDIDIRNNSPSEIDYNFNDLVVFSKETIANKLDVRFSHETEHFLLESSKSSKITDKVNNIVDDFSSSENIDSAVKNCIEMRNSIENTIKEEHSSKIKQSVSEKMQELYPNLEVTDPKYSSIFDTLCSESYGKVLTNEFESSGVLPLTDLLNSLTLGKYSKELKLSTHDSSYYESSSGIAASEVMANFAALYNGGNDGLVGNVLSSNIQQDLTNIHKSLLENNVNAKTTKSQNSAIMDKLNLFGNFELYEEDSFVVLSDFHGANWVLDKVKNHYMSEYETIFNLGDITDRGQDSVAMLREYKNLAKQNPDRVFYVPGNHDEFIYGAFRGKDKATQYFYARNLFHNGGEETYNDLVQLRQNNPQEFNELLDWLGEQPIQRIHEYDGKKYALAHAFFNYDLYKQAPNFSLSDYMKYGGMQKRGAESYFSSILWYRKNNNNYQISKNLLPPSDYTMVIGHTPQTPESIFSNNLDIDNIKVVCVDGGANSKKTNGFYSTRKFDGGSGPEITVMGEHHDTSNHLSRENVNQTSTDNYYKILRDTKKNINTISQQIEKSYTKYNQTAILAVEETVRKHNYNANIKKQLYGEISHGVFDHITNSNNVRANIKQAYTEMASLYEQKNLLEQYQSEISSKILQIINDTKESPKQFANAKVDTDPKLALECVEQQSDSIMQSGIFNKVLDKYIDLTDEGHIKEAIDYANQSNDPETIKFMRLDIVNIIEKDPKQVLDIAKELDSNAIANYFKAKIYNYAQDLLNVDINRAIDYANKSGDQKIINSINSDVNFLLNKKNKFEPILTPEELNNLFDFKDSSNFKNSNNGKLRKFIENIKEKLSFPSGLIFKRKIKDLNGHTTLEYGCYYKNIRFKSNSKEGVKLLQHYYSHVKDYSSSNKVRSDFLSKLEKIGVIISEIPEYEGAFQYENTEYEGAFQYANTINFSTAILENNTIFPFFHESGHYFDFLSKRYENGLKLINDAISKANFISLEQQQKLINSCNALMQEIYKYINSPSVQNEIDMLAKKKFSDIMEKDSTIYTPEQQQQIYTRIKKDVYHSKVDRCVYDSGLAAISDIFDAMTIGAVCDKNLLIGHGGEYYSKNDVNVSTEIFANFASLYLQGKTELIDKFISKEFREDLEMAYKSVVGLD